MNDLILVPSIDNCIIVLGSDEGNVIRKFLLELGIRSKQYCMCNCYA